MDIEVYTARYEREHGHRPEGRRFWRFTLVSSSVTTRDHFLDLGEQMTYSQALAMAQEVARLRKSERIIVEPMSAGAAKARAGMSPHQQKQAIRSGIRGSIRTKKRPRHSACPSMRRGRHSSRTPGSQGQGAGMTAREQ